jgi:O-acetyl-ADP-ribose deacetylase
MKTSVGTTALEVVSREVPALGVDAIIVATTTGLTMDSGLAAELKSAGGEQIENEAMAQGPIEIGDAIATTGGALAAKWVIHAAVEGSAPVDANLVAQATTRALQVADRLRVRSVALEAFSDPSGVLDIYASTSIMVGRARQYLEERRHSGLRRILFSAPDDLSRAAFKNAIAGSTRF